MAPKAPPSSAPIHFVKPEYCPEAVIDWYECTGGSQLYKHAGNVCTHNRDLSNKAKKHLSFLGWKFWYAYKKTSRELRYQSPKNGKTYNSLKTACKSCIEDGGCIPFKNVVQNQPSSTMAISPSSAAPHTTTNTSTLNQQPRKYKKPSVQEIRCSKKNQRKTESSEDEWSSTMAISPSSIQPSSTIVISPSSEEVHITTTTTLKEQPRKYKKPSVQEMRCNKKNKRKSESSEDEWSPELNALNKRRKVLRSSKIVRHETRVQERKCNKKNQRKSESSEDEWSPGTRYADHLVRGSFASNKRRKILRSSKRVRHESSCRDSSLPKPSTITSWLIDNNVVVLEAKVFCNGGNNNVVKQGKLLRSGIVCSCCGLLFSLTRFEAHAGCTKHRPTANIFLEDGRSLQDCRREALNISHHHDFNTTNYTVQSDSICSVCHYGGDLMLCDRCPSAFHHTCLGLEQVPDGDWFCPSCCCKICNQTRYSEDCAADHVDNSVLVCDQCERKYHIGCVKNRDFAKVKNSANKNWFCNSDCESIYFSLLKLIGKPIPVGPVEDNLTLTFLKTMKSDDQIESKLSVALGVMHECFEPTIDALSGRDIAADVIFSRGSEHNRLNFRGFYTVILERNDEVISVATIRIFGQRVAEVPLVATRRQFRRQGMCRILMNEIENCLTRFGVERMILPAAHEVVDTWTNSFGFERMPDADKSQFRDYTFLDFQDSIACHKPLKKP